MAETREEIYRKIAESSVRSGLGFFAGAGFSMALCGEDEPALGWGALVESCAEKMGATEELAEIIDNDFSLGMGYPEISSKMSRVYAENNNIPKEEFQQNMKSIIAKATFWLPTLENRNRYAEYMKEIDPSFFITTNYDQVVESILDGKGYSLDPGDDFISPKHKIPVYHMHGSRLNPQNIIIFQEDYVSLFRPNDYRQIKLALTIRESTTIILGYGLGDMNVLSAIDWAENYYRTSNTEQVKADIYQIVRKTGDEIKEPYPWNGTNIKVLEVADITEFMEALLPYIEEVKAEDKANQQEIDDILTKINVTGTDYFLEQTEETLQEIKSLVTHEKAKHLTVDLFEFIEVYGASYEEEFVKAKTTKGAFSRYATSLELSLMIIDQYDDLNDMHPNLFSVILNNLDSVLKWAGPVSDIGKSWKADRMWKNHDFSEQNLRLINDSAVYRELKELARYSERSLDQLVIKEIAEMEEC